MRPEARFYQRFSRALSVREDYESHKRKLDELSKKKSPYSMNISIAKQQEIKYRNNNNFIRNRAKNLQSIDKANNTMFERLMGCQQLSRKTYVANATKSFLKQSSYQRLHVDKPLTYQVLKSNNQQNNKFYGRLISLKPTINRSKILSDYNASCQIKNRIRKFQGACSKSNRFVQKQLQKKRSISHKSRTSLSESILIKDTKSTITQKSQDHYSSVYNPRDVLKNKITQPTLMTKNRIRQLRRISFRPFNNKLINDITKFVDQNTLSNSKRFFSTQVEITKPKTFSLQNSKRT